jgi:hypothetical protein
MKIKLAYTAYIDECPICKSEHFVVFRPLKVQSRVNDGVLGFWTVCPETGDIFIKENEIDYENAD